MSNVEEQVQSTVSCLQIYLHRSQTSISASSFAFYRLHITLLNHTENIRKQKIVSGSTILANPPVRYCETGEKSS